MHFERKKEVKTEAGKQNTVLDSVRQTDTGITPCVIERVTS